MKKRFLSILLVLAMVLSFVPGMSITASAEEMSEVIAFNGNNTAESDHFTLDTKMTAMWPDGWVASWSPIVIEAKSDTNVITAIDAVVCTYGDHYSDVRYSSGEKAETGEAADGSAVHVNNISSNRLEIYCDSGSVQFNRITVYYFHVHDFSGEGRDNGDGTHSRKCTGCDATDTGIAHFGGTATCQAKAKCTVCGAEYGETAEHDYDTAWTTDGTNHWRKCKTEGCTAVTDKAKHRFIGNTCTDCGYIRHAGIDPVAPITPAKPTLPFEDVKLSDWSYDDIAYVYENGLMNGVSETTFAPKMDTSRAIIVTILWRLEGEPVVNYAMSFKDVAPDQWYTEAIRWAQASGIVNGYSAEKFGVNDPITREQMAAILHRFCESIVK